jgi:hypothetical protein
MIREVVSFSFGPFVAVTSVIVNNTTSNNDPKETERYDVPRIGPMLFGSHHMAYEVVWKDSIPALL